MKHVTFLLALALLVNLFEISNQSQSITDSEKCEEIGPWSSILEDWTTGYNHRQMRIMKLGPTHGYYIVDRIDRNSSEMSKLTPPPPPGPPGKIVNRPPYYHQKEKPQTAQQLQDFKPSRIDTVEPQRKEVSETDLYLLSAIEKLVYRVDFMEKRVRKLEESMYQVLDGMNNRPSTDRISDVCDHNYSQVGDNCYHFGNNDKYDWKTANLVCKKLKGNLIELETLQEKKAVVAHLQAQKNFREKDYWTGGLNPGLLWMWSYSGRPVNPDKNTTQTTTIHGEGRCLKLSYNPALRSYEYFGTDCSLRQHFICEMPEKSLTNEIDRISKELKHKQTVL